MPDELKTRCTCPNCRIRGLMGPVMLITIGVLFLVGIHALQHRRALAGSADRRRHRSCGPGHGFSRRAHRFVRSA